MPSANRSVSGNPHEGASLSSISFDSPVGRLRVAARGRGLTAVYWPDGAAERVPRDPVDGGDNPYLKEAALELTAYFRGSLRRFSVPLDPIGTPFQVAVWSALVAIPFGETTNYRAVATAIGRPSAVRAVGAAVGRNPLCIVVPCHRVVGSNGALTGFSGGLDIKRHLLALEGRGGLL